MGNLEVTINLPCLKLNIPEDRILNFIRICFSFRELKSNNFFEVRKVPTSSWHQLKFRYAPLPHIKKVLESLTTSKFDRI